MKFLINPFFWYLIPQFAGLMIFQWLSIGLFRSLSRVLLLLTLLLGIISTSLVHKGLESLLVLIPKSDTTMTPSFIFVLGGGYYPSLIPDEDILNNESQRRVLHGISLWRRYPNAHLVFSGALEYKGIRELNRHAQLMSEAAIHRGVPATSILLEPFSRNTQEHPIKALTLTGISPETPIALVTSSWHMRRAQREFSRYFQHIQIDPVPELKQPLVWQDFIPDAGALNANTTLLREWVGMLWYTIH